MGKVTLMSCIGGDSSSASQHAGKCRGVDICSIAPHIQKLLSGMQCFPKDMYLSDRVLYKDYCHLVTGTSSISYKSGDAE